MSGAPPGRAARYLGVDLAWGERSRTGLAVLSASGRLLASAAVRSDDEVVGFVARHTGDTVVAAVDAPLVVPNATGRRDCEAQVGRLFGRYHAGPYPANRGLAAFRDGPRGGRLAQRLGWTTDPRVRPAPGRRVAVEVYPHPAMVSLFGLARVLPYKQRPGRDLAALTAAWRRLLDHVEGTCGAVLDLPGSARWHEVRAVAASPCRKADLARIEDEVDAIWCAYLAWLWAVRPDALVVHGDHRRGHIVTPPPPCVPPSSPRSPTTGASPPAGSGHGLPEPTNAATGGSTAATLSAATRTGSGSAST